MPELWRLKLTYIFLSHQRYQLYKMQAAIQLFSTMASENIKMFVNIRGRTPSTCQLQSGMMAFQVTKNRKLWKALLPWSTSHGIVPHLTWTIQEKNSYLRFVFLKTEVKMKTTCKLNSLKSWSTATYTFEMLGSRIGSTNKLLTITYNFPSTGFELLPNFHSGCLFSESLTLIQKLLMKKYSELAFVNWPKSAWLIIQSFF